MKDIFIDNNIAKNFVNPIDNNYKELIKWLILFNENKDNDAHLVVNQLLLTEYHRSAYNCAKPNAIPQIINKLTREGRLVKISNFEINEFKRLKFKPKVLKRLTCNDEDQDHIPTILLSKRKIALTIDDNLFNDLINFPGYIVTVSKRPEEIDYK